MGKKLLRRIRVSETEEIFDCGSECGGEVEEHGDSESSPRDEQAGNDEAQKSAGRRPNDPGTRPAKETTPELEPAA